MIYPKSSKCGYVPTSRTTVMPGVTDYGHAQEENKCLDHVLTSLFDSSFSRERNAGAAIHPIERMRTRRFAFTKLSGAVLMRQIFMFDFLASNVEAVKLRDMPRYADRAESFRLTDNSQDPRDISQMVRSSEQRSVPPVNELKDLASDPTKSSPNGTPMITLLLLPCRAASFRSM